MKIKKVEPYVREVLTNDKSTRDDDFKLYVSVIYEMYGANAVMQSVMKFMTNAQSSKMPPFETVTRARRKLQHNHEKLRGEKYNKRLEKQAEYIEYSKN